IISPVSPFLTYYPITKRVDPKPGKLESRTIYDGRLLAYVRLVHTRLPGWLNPPIWSARYPVRHKGVSPRPSTLRLGEEYGPDWEVHALLCESLKPILGITQGDLTLKPAGPPQLARLCVCVDGKTVAWLGWWPKPIGIDEALSLQRIDVTCLRERWAEE